MLGFMGGAAGETDPRYPIGTFQYAGASSESARRSFIDEIAETPLRMQEALHGLSEEQLDTPYRSGGWTVRQVAHHVPDSHLNAYVRLKLALTEEHPVIKPYDEAQWAALPDAREAPVAISVTLLTALHQRWTLLLRALAPADFERRFLHPERGVMTVDELVALYAWHGRHHVAHITSLRERKAWR